MHPELGQIVCAGSDFLRPFQLCFSKEGMDHIVWKQAGVQESSGPVSGRMQLAR